MTVWETVVAGSTLESGTFWEHLNAQSGGTGPGDPVYIPVEAYRDLDFLSAASVDHEDITQTADAIDTLSVHTTAGQLTADATTENTLEVICPPL